MIKARFLSVSTAVCLVVALSLPQAGAGTISENLRDAGWDMLTFDGIAASSFVKAPDGAIEVRADGSSSVLYRPVADDQRKSTRISWSWQVVQGLPATDLRQPDGDDRVLAVHVVFRDDSLLARMASAMNPFASGKVLTYVWGGHDVDEFPHPHLPERGRMIIRRPAGSPMDIWFDEEIDLEADFQKAFGDAPPKIAFIGISGDADDLGEMCYGRIRNLTLN